MQNLLCFKAKRKQDFLLADWGLVNPTYFANEVVLLLPME